MSARPAKLLASLLLMLLAPPLAAAQELRYLQVEQTGRLAAGEQTIFLATCPEGLKIVAGGYKLVTSELPPLHLVLVESRPVPERRQWAITLLYEPPRPAALPAGKVRLEVWVVCTGQATGRPGELSQKSGFEQYGAATASCEAPWTDKKLRRPWLEAAVCAMEEERLGDERQMCL